MVAINARLLLIMGYPHLVLSSHWAALGDTERFTERMQSLPAAKH
jgi:hypothetical protein